MTSNLLTGDLVLCKVGSFAPWPAVVFPQRFLRKDVYRRRRADCVAVCFFNDETYFWDKPSRLKPLSKEHIDEFLRNADSRYSEDPVLVRAYEEARDFTSLHEFLLQRLREEKRMLDMEENGGKDHKIEAGQDPFEGKTPSAKTSREGIDGKGDKAGSAGRSGKSKASRSSSSSRSVSSSSRPQPAVSSPPSSTAPSRKLARLDHGKRIEISMLLRRKLQTNLVQRNAPPGVDEIKESHKLLSKISENMASNPQFFDLEALRVSKLHKLLKVIVSDDNLKEFHGQCSDVLEAWKDAIAQLRKEKVRAQES
ncbi:LADA_0C12420g1_1 [Lachancea dasiensis]|uniref:LADA_0C12420g1_1 n=1 Tax=Lachancea dasiensis TaxID=1072105 RepID=A0A1G4J1S4_9SACH|nr:LADA_0C12420g1_1 [Lachancea dasiensis]